MKNNIICIYQIKNLIDNKVYIGSTINFYHRCIQHKSALNTGKHNNIYFLNSWNKYGETNFEFRILEECTKEELTEKEQYWIQYYQSYDRFKGYNLNPTPYGSRDRIKTPEERKKISIGNKGKILSQETRDRMGKSRTGEKHPMYGKHLSEEHKQKISNSHKGKTTWNKGKKLPPLSEEHKEKIRQSNMGKKYTKEQKRNISLTKRGEKHHMVKLTYKIVEEIRFKYNPRIYTMKMLANEYNVSHSAIQSVIEKRTWPDIYD